MVIYGLGLLTGCFISGIMLGDILGALSGVDSNVGGVGFAMLFLILVSNYLMHRDMLSPDAKSGIEFWNKMYIPVVVAMSASQNVVAAINAGPLALLAGTVSVFACFAFMPLLGKLGGESKSFDEMASEESGKGVAK